MIFLNLRKVSLYIIFFLLSSISVSTAEILNQFKIDGNERIPKETIKIGRAHV